MGRYANGPKNDVAIQEVNFVREAARNDPRDAQRNRVTEAVEELDSRVRQELFDARSEILPRRVVLAVIR